MNRYGGLGSGLLQSGEPGLYGKGGHEKPDNDAELALEGESGEQGDAGVDGESGVEAARGGGIGHLLTG